MSACSVSSRRAALPVLLALALLALLAPGRADARRHQAVVHRVTGASRVVIDHGGVVVTTDDTTTLDSASHVRVGGGDDDVDVDDQGGTVDINGPVIHIHDDGAGLVRVFADAEVPAGKHVDGDVVAVFGSVDVGGNVSGDVVAVFGSVKLRPGASVSGDVVSIGGALDHATGATVGGQSVSLGFLPIAWGMPALPALLGTVLAMWFATVLFGWLLAALARPRLARAAITASRHTAGSFVLGVLSMPMLVLVMTLLFVTLIGIPVAVLVLVLYPLLVWAGQVVGSYLIGCRLLRRRPGEGGMLAPIAAGGLLVAAFFVAAALLSAPEGPVRSVALFCAMLGLLLATGLGAIGTGALLLSRGGQRPEDVALEGAVPPMAPLTPAMPPAVPPVA